MISKYVRTNRGIKVFDTTIYHSEQVEDDEEVISAGFFVKFENNLIVYGSSTTLEVNSLPEDANLIKEVLCQL